MHQARAYHVTLHYTISWNDKLCHMMLAQIIPCHVIVSWHTMLCHVMWCTVMTCHVMSCKAKSPHVRSGPVRSRHVMPRHLQVNSSHVEIGYVTAWTFLTWLFISCKLLNLCICRCCAVVIPTQHILRSATVETDHVATVTCRETASQKLLTSLSSITSSVSQNQVTFLLYLKGGKQALLLKHWFECPRILS